MSRKGLAAIDMGIEYRYRRLDDHNFTGHSLDDFVRRQTVAECWRKINNDWQLVPNVYEENWSQAQCRKIAEDVARHIDLDQTGFGAFDGKRIIGFATVSHRLFGVTARYVQLVCFQISEGYRRQGIGRKLFPWPAKRPGGWARTNCIFRLIPQKSLRRRTGRLAVRLRRRSMRDWRQRNPLMSKWNTDYKRAAIRVC